MHALDTGEHLVHARCRSPSLICCQLLLGALQCNEDLADVGWLVRRQEAEISGVAEVASHDAIEGIRQIDVVLMGELGVGDLDAHLLEDDALGAEGNLLPLHCALRLTQRQGPLGHLDLLALCAAVDFQLPAKAAVPLRVAILRLHESLGDAMRNLVRDAPCARVLDRAFERAVRIARIVDPDVAFLVALLLQLRQAELNALLRVALEAEVLDAVAVGVCHGLHEFRVLDQCGEVVDLLLRIGVRTSELAKPAVGLSYGVCASGEDSIQGYWCVDFPRPCTLAGENPFLEPGSGFFNAGCEFTLCALKGLPDFRVFCLADTTGITFSVGLRRPIILGEFAHGAEVFDLDAIQREDLIDRLVDCVVEIRVGFLGVVVGDSLAAADGIITEVHHAEAIGRRHGRVLEGLLVRQTEGVAHALVDRAVHQLDLAGGQLPAEVGIDAIRVALVRGEQRPVPADCVQLQQPADHRGVGRQHALGAGVDVGTLAALRRGCWREQDILLRGADIHVPCADAAEGLVADHAQPLGQPLAAGVRVDHDPLDLSLEFQLLSEGCAQHGLADLRAGRRAPRYDRGVLGQLIEVVGLRALHGQLGLAVGHAQRQLTEQCVDLLLVRGSFLGVAFRLQDHAAVLAAGHQLSVALADRLAPAGLTDHLPPGLDRDPDGGLRLLRLPAKSLGQLLDLGLCEDVLEVGRRIAQESERALHPQVDGRALADVVVRGVDFAHQVVVEVRDLQARRLDAALEPLERFLVLDPGGAADVFPGLPLVPHFQRGGRIGAYRGAGRVQGEQANEQACLLHVAAERIEHSLAAALVPESAGLALERQLLQDLVAQAGDLLGGLRARRRRDDLPLVRAGLELAVGDDDRILGRPKGCRVELLQMRGNSLAELSDHLGRPVGEPDQTLGNFQGANLDKVSVQLGALREGAAQIKQRALHGLVHLRLDAGLGGLLALLQRGEGVLQGRGDGVRRGLLQLLLVQELGQSDCLVSLRVLLLADHLIQLAVLLRLSLRLAGLSLRVSSVLLLGPTHGLLFSFDALADVQRDLNGLQGCRVAHLGLRAHGLQLGGAQVECVRVLLELGLQGGHVLSGGHGILVQDGHLLGLEDRIRLLGFRFNNGLRQSLIDIHLDRGRLLLGLRRLGRGLGHRGGRLRARGGRFTELGRTECPAPVRGLRALKKPGIPEPGADRLLLQSDRQVVQFGRGQGPVQRHDHGVLSAAALALISHNAGADIGQLRLDRVRGERIDLLANVQPDVDDVLVPLLLPVGQRAAALRQEHQAAGGGLLDEAEINQLLGLAVRQRSVGPGRHQLAKGERGLAVDGRHLRRVSGGRRLSRGLSGGLFRGRRFPAKRFGLHGIDASAQGLHLLLCRLQV